MSRGYQCIIIIIPELYMTYCKSTILGPLIQKGVNYLEVVQVPRQGRQSFDLISRSLTRWSPGIMQEHVSQLKKCDLERSLQFDILESSRRVISYLLPLLMFVLLLLFQHTRPVERDVSMCRSFRISLSWFLFQVAQDGGQSHEHRNCEGFVPVSPGSVT